MCCDRQEREPQTWGTRPEEEKSHFQYRGRAEATAGLGLSPGGRGCREHTARRQSSPLLGQEPSAEKVLLTPGPQLLLSPQDLTGTSSGRPGQAGFSREADDNGRTPQAAPYTSVSPASSPAPSLSLTPWSSPRRGDLEERAWGVSEAR